MTDGGITIWNEIRNSLYRFSFGQRSKLLFTSVAGKHTSKFRDKLQKGAQCMYPGGEGEHRKNVQRQDASIQSISPSSPITVGSHAP